VITEKHIYHDNTPISKKYEMNLLGRHSEIHELLKFLTNKHEGIEKVYFIHDNDQKCSKEISDYSAWYLQHRNKFKDGRFLLDMKNHKHSGSIYEEMGVQMSFSKGTTLSILIKTLQDSQN